MADPNGNSISLNYSADSENSGADPLILYTNSTSTNSMVENLQYATVEKYNPLILNFIVSQSGNYTFTYTKNGYTNQSVITGIEGNGIKYMFNYSLVTAGTSYSRLFLRGFTTSDCNSPIRYNFSYIGETSDSGNDWNYHTSLPDSSFKAIDFWGYYNQAVANTSLVPKVYINPLNPAYSTYHIATDFNSRPDYTIILDGANRAANSQTVMTGALSKISYLDNASTTITYESNDFFDVTSGGNVPGGGIRVKQLVDYDGINADKSTVRNFSYVVPGSSNSSGAPINLPAYAFVRPYSGSTSSNFDL